MPSSLADILADPGPQPGEGYNHEDPHLLRLWNKVQTHLADINDVSSHSTEGTSYTRDLQRSETLLMSYYEAYLLRKRTLTVASASDEIRTRETNSRGVRFDAIPFHTL